MSCCGCPPSEFSETRDEDDRDRCEDRSTQPLLHRVEQIHDILDDIAAKMRTTVAARARDVTGTCVVVFGGGAQHDLTLKQKQALIPPLEVPSELKDAHAEVTALTHIQTRNWEPLALAIAPPQRTICGKCATFIQASGGKVATPRTAVWP